MIAVCPLNLNVQEPMVLNIIELLEVGLVKADWPMKVYTWKEITLSLHVQIISHGVGVYKSRILSFSGLFLVFCHVALVSTMLHITFCIKMP